MKKLLVIALALGLVACEKEGLQPAYINADGDIVNNKGNFVKAQTEKLPETEYTCVNGQVWERLDTDVWVKRVHEVQREKYEVYMQERGGVRNGRVREKTIESKICLTNAEASR